jgi:hypothetical protein
MSQDAIAASALAGLVPALKALARVNPDELQPTTLGDGVVELNRVSDLLKGERARWLATFERRRGHLDEGAPSMTPTARCATPTATTSALAST